jgi:hypothetical protein
MPFGNPILAGVYLVREAIRSPDYSPGVSGWSINRDGSAEFADVDLRGPLLLTGPNGSFVWIVLAGSNAAMQLNPPDASGVSYAPAQIIALNTGGSDKRPYLTIESPKISPAGSKAFLDLLGVGVTSPATKASLLADEIRFGSVVNSWTDIFVHGVSQGQGFRDVTAQTTSSAAIGAEAVVETISNFVWRDGRAYEVLLGGRLTTSVANTAIFQLRRTNLAGAILSTFGGFTFGAAVAGWPLTQRTVITRAAGAGDLTQTVVCTLQASAGTATHLAATGRPRFLQINDIGAAADHTEGVAA